MNVVDYLENWELSEMTQELNKEGLLPCPFCGGKAGYMYGGSIVAVVCGNDDCPVDDSWNYHTEEAAAKAWNTRRHPKVTGFEPRIADAVDDLHDNGFDDVIVLLEDMQAALSGGSHD